MLTSGLQANIKDTKLKLAQLENEYAALSNSDSPADKRHAVYLASKIKDYKDLIFIYDTVNPKRH